MTNDEKKNTLANDIAALMKAHILAGTTAGDAFDSLHEALAWFISQNVNDEGRRNMLVAVITTTPRLVARYRAALGGPQAGDVMVNQDGTKTFISEPGKS